MENHIGKLIIQKRISKGLKRSQLAAMVGYSNISRGARKITKLERDGVFRPDFLKKLIRALEISKKEFEEAFQKEKAEFEEWLDVPVPMRMIVRYMPAVYVSHSLPDHVKSEEAAVQYVKNFTSDKNLKACLVLNRRWSFWSERGGGVWKETTFENQVNRPFMSIGGQPFQISADEICDVQGDSGQ